MKKAVWFCLALCAALCLCACGADDPSAGAQTYGSPAVPSAPAAPVLPTDGDGTAARSDISAPSAPSVPATPSDIGAALPEPAGDIDPVITPEPAQDTKPDPQPIIVPKPVIGGGPAPQAPAVVKIVNTALSQPDLAFAQALEKIYEDKHATYYFNCIMSSYVIVWFSDGTQADIKTALNSGMLTIEEAKSHGVGFIEESKNLSEY